MESAPYYGKLDRSGMTSVPGACVQPGGDSEYGKLDRVNKENFKEIVIPLASLSPRWRVLHTMASRIMVERRVLH